MELLIPCSRCYDFEGFTCTGSHLDEAVKSLSSSAPELSSISLGAMFELPVLSSCDLKCR